MVQERRIKDKLIHFLEKFALKHLAPIPDDRSIQEHHKKVDEYHQNIFNKNPKRS